MHLINLLSQKPKFMFPHSQRFQRKTLIDFQEIIIVLNRSLKIEFQFETRNAKIIIYITYVVF